MENNTSNNSAKLNFGLSDRSKGSSDNKVTAFGGFPVKESVDENLNLFLVVLKKRILM